MDVKKIWTYIKSLPSWARILAIVAAAVAAVALTSCTRRAFHVKGKAEKLEFEYRDTLYSKSFLR